jgi:hypothetical protein
MGEGGIMIYSYSSFWLMPKYFSVMVSVVEPEPRAEEPKLHCPPEPEPKLRNAAPAPFCLPQT